MKHPAAKRPLPEAHGGAKRKRNTRKQRPRRPTKRRRGQQQKNCALAQNESLRAERSHHHQYLRGTTRRRIKFHATGPWSIVGCVGGALYWLQVDIRRRGRGGVVMGTGSSVGVLLLQLCLWVLRRKIAVLDGDRLLWRWCG